MSGGVVIIGGSGHLGSRIVQSWLSETDMPITIITRAESEASFTNDARISVHKGDYTSVAFLKEAMTGQSVLVCAMGLTAAPESVELVYKTAAAAGMKWIIPQGWGNDWQNAQLAARVPPMSAAKASRSMITELGIPYTGFITNPWLDWNISSGLFSIDVASRKATLYTGAVTRFNTTTIAQVALAVVRFVRQLLQPEPNFRIEDYRDREVYIRSFLLTQKELLEAVQQATNTSADDWKVEMQDVQVYIRDGESLMGQGQFMRGLFQVLFGCLYSEGFGGDYESDKGVDNAVLGLPQEDLDLELGKAIKG
ncbi:hypothetical protein LTR10_013393 [Elasticomyces elasticus]|uniref:NAD(P)-binding domain-containing protein n=1 Tax=Exophiala sideris TaxID=1016849 RepID=A0ABR0J4L6_9EURO|nr:hypothetical protein LTR10_013393 [Elasticomyces elasticus]KAK5027377.1 hypothetical protein LTS07_006979 [Exophiala sideris]KAK5034921.1 hypothetical protein LTR13_006103 [Exophiala sideris]KAK5056345.1 hypothetical protein LTR69_007886 [Exophiala sideris]KAK5181166.1 hypothetical protein LTR44_006497 [Eurotiomycetes sp. CCFEE 6388]